jgi:hypothetical protein
VLLDHWGLKIMSATECIHNYGMKFNICIERIVDTKIFIMSLGNDSHLGQYRKSDEIVTGVGKKVMKL